MRWRQDRVTGKLIPIDEGAARRDSTEGAAVSVFESFVSPIDGSYIGNSKALKEHNDRHSVVHSHEVSESYLAERRRKRDMLYTGEHTKQEKLARKREIYETIIRAERNGH
jgi:hypothetical protein